MVIHDFDEHVCIRYILLVCMKATSYRDDLNALLADGQLAVSILAATELMPGRVVMHYIVEMLIVTTYLALAPLRLMMTVMMLSFLRCNIFLRFSFFLF